MYGAILLGLILGVMLGVCSCLVSIDTGTESVIGFIIGLFLIIICSIGLYVLNKVDDSKELSNFLDTDEIYILNTNKEVETSDTSKFKLMDLNEGKGKYYVKGLYNKEKYIINIDEDLYNILKTNYGYDIKEGKTYELNLKLDKKSFYIDDLRYKKYEDLEAVEDKE